jgi:hypothetical protein
MDREKLAQRLAVEGRTAQDRLGLTHTRIVRGKTKVGNRGSSRLKGFTTKGAKVKVISRRPELKLRALKYF